MQICDSVRAVQRHPNGILPSGFSIRNLFIQLASPPVIGRWSTAGGAFADSQVPDWVPLSKRWRLHELNCAYPGGPSSPPSRSHRHAEEFPVLRENEQTLAHHRFSQAIKPNRTHPPNSARNESPTPAATIRAIHRQLMSKQPPTSGHTPPSMIPALLQNLTTGHSGEAAPSLQPQHPPSPILKGAFQKPRQPRASASKRPGKQKPSEARPPQPPTAGHLRDSLIHFLTRSLTTGDKSPATTSKPLHLRGTFLSVPVPRSLRSPRGHTLPHRIYRRKHHGTLTASNGKTSGQESDNSG